MKTDLKALPCPFCGSEIDLEDEDTMHITGAWKTFRGKHRAYTFPNDPTAEGYVYGIHCNVIYGGCGASIDADGVDEVVTAWNKRT